MTGVVTAVGAGVEPGVEPGVVTVTARWVRFNLVGLAGFVVQLTTLSLLLRYTPLSVSGAVAAAVLVAVSHNFMWHERLTWPGLPTAGRCRRWMAFNLSNGAISLVTNIPVTGVVVLMTGASAVVANVVAVLAASALNFYVSDRLVFSRPATGGSGEPIACTALRRPHAKTAWTGRVQGHPAADRGFIGAGTRADGSGLA